MFVKPRMNLFERMQLQEAEGDDANAIMNTGVDQNTTNTDPGQEGNPPATDNGGEAESTSDDDLDLDVNLDTPDDAGGGDDTGNDDAGSGDTGTDDGFGGGDTSSSTEPADNPEEVKKGNTDLFASLTAEEQSIKIMELKKLYNEMYTSVDDLLDKLDDIALEDINPHVIIRITSQMTELRRILQDYIINSFPIKTYYENDVNYSIFLNMFATLRGVFDEISKEKQRNSGKNN